MNTDAATYNRLKNIYKVAWLIFSSAKYLTVIAAYFLIPIIEQKMYSFLFLIPVILFAVLSVRSKRKMYALERAENKEKQKA